MEFWEVALPKSVFLIIVIISLFVVIICRLIKIIKQKYNGEGITIVEVFGFAVCFIIESLVFLELAYEIKDNGGVAVSYITDATIIAVGNQGITVEYCFEEDGYGEKTVKKAKIISEDKNDHHMGDTVTIQVEKNIFLSEPRITIVEEEKLQDIDYEGCKAEGICVDYKTFSKGYHENLVNLVKCAYISAFSKLWNSTIKNPTLKDTVGTLIRGFG